LIISLSYFYQISINIFACSIFKTSLLPLKPLTQANEALGVKVQADVKNNPTDTGDGQPSVIFYQQGINSVQITVIPVNAARAETLKQNGNNFTLIQIPVGKTPIVETKQGDLSSLLN
jgi:hypothetical protein